MRYELKRTNSQIDAVLNKAQEAEDEGATKVPGMTYEQGVKAGISWVLGDSNDDPMAD